MKYGIIGTGWIAASFIEGARLVCGAEITAVLSRTREKGSAFAEENSIGKVYTDIDEFSKGDFEAVYIASPNALHYPQSKKMLLAGKHVICEKPITVEPEELEELQALAKEKGLIYMEAIMYMHNPGREIFRDAVSKIGKITKSDLMELCPGIGKTSIENSLKKLVAEGSLCRHGGGRSTYYTRNDAK